MGSRGAGFCISRGVTSSVEVRDATDPVIEVRLNGEPLDAPVTRLAVELYLETPQSVRVESTVELPIAQGFGMSGAGALSTLLALDAALEGGRGREELVALAHEAEVRSRTGLGDVVPQSLGGLEVRELPGAPPYGRVHRLPFEGEVVLCVVGPPLATRTILSNPMVLQSINSVGGRCVDRFLRQRTMDALLDLSWLFARQTVLATSDIQEAVLKANLHGHASMCMLGHAIFALGETNRLEAALREHGEVYRASVAPRGAHLLDARAA